MAYTKQEWQNGDPTTPLSAARLNHIEEGLAAALDAESANATYVTGRPPGLVSTLRRGTRDAVLVLLGDSTGNETSEWLHLALTDLAAEFPAHTVLHHLWNDASQSYDAPTTIQDGTGPRTLRVYNGSVTGQNAAYIYSGATVTARLAAMIPSPADAVVLSYGYNWTAPSYRWEILRAARAVRGRQPLADIALVSQPPMNPAHANAANHAVRSADVRAVAAQEGFGLIDAYQSFIDYGDAWPEDLISADLLHPTATGSRVWADEARRWLRGAPTVTDPRSPHPSGDRVFIPATQFIASAGTPELIWVNPIAPAWALDAATDEAIGTSFDVPSEWGRCNVYLVWFTPQTSGAAVFVPRYGRLSFFEANVSGVSTAPAAYGPTTVSANSPANAMRFTSLLGWDRPEPADAPGRIAAGRPLVMSVTRDADAAGDTLAGDAYIVGVLIERAE
jgi:lysophospholipase L1-like esterase